jgi:signal transduction histidine kinase
MPPTWRRVFLHNLGATPIDKLDGRGYKTEVQSQGVHRGASIADVIFGGVSSAATPAVRGKVESAAEREPVARPVSRAIGTQRLIDLGRATLALYGLIALAIEPPPVQLARFSDLLLYAFAAYAMCSVVLGAEVTSRRWLIARLSGDLAFFSLLTLLTPQLTTPFFLGFIFSIVCAALLFDTAGTVATALAAVAAYAIAGMLSPQVFPTLFLAIISALIVGLKIHETRVLRDARHLAAWPHGVPASLPEMLEETLQQAGEMMHARIVIAWQDVDHPTMRVATMSGEELIVNDEPFTASNPLLDRDTPRRFVSAALSTNPLSAAFRRRYRIDEVIGCRFDCESASGWLLAADKIDVTSDALLLADIVAGLVESRFEQFYLSERLRQNVLSEERVRFARDLHDGILQSLTGTAMHLQRLRDLIARDPDAARMSLQKVQEAIIEDQLEVRSYVDRLRSAVLIDEHPLLGTRLLAVAERVLMERGTVVRVDVSPIVEMMSPGMAEEAYRVIREAVMNAASHADAKCISVEVSIVDDHLRIVVEDDGHGFPFMGRYDLHQLTLQRRGPVTLKERIWALMGNMIIDSRPTGARLEIDLPTSLAKVPM